jgi:hypothetical protein
MTILLSIIAGVFGGLSAGIGLWPVFKQPKNIKIQTLLAIVAVIALIILLKQLK